MSLTGTDKSAILLMTLGEDRAAEVFKHLSSREVQLLSGTMAGMSQVSHKQLGEILTEFEDDAEQYAALSVNASDYLRSVLVKALGEERAASLLEDILESRETTTGMETLNFMEPQSAADLIRDEHPQIIATILVHLKRGQAADILALFDERLRNDVMLRIATFGGVQPAALAELTEVLNNLLDGQNLKRSKMGGVRTAAEIINLMKTQQEEAVIDAMREYDGELAQKIIDEMFLFENLVEVDDRSIQRLLQEVEGESLLIALKGAEQPLREVPQEHVATRRRHPARRSGQPWPGAHVAGGERAESHPVGGETPGGNRRNDHRRRRGHLCLIALTPCPGSPGRSTIWANRNRRSNCRRCRISNTAIRRRTRRPNCNSSWRRCGCRPSNRASSWAMPTASKKAMRPVFSQVWKKAVSKGCWKRSSSNSR